MILRKIVSYVDSDTSIAEGTLKQKREINKLLSLGCQVNYDGPNNIVWFHLDGKDVLKTTLRRYSSDFMVFRQILIQREYQPLVEHIKKHDLENNILSIVDAGTNIGLTTLYLKFFFAGAKVYCIEPDLNNYEALNKNFKLNGLKDYDTIRAAVWYKNELLSLSNNFRDGKEWSISVESNDERSNSLKDVQGITISELMSQKNLRHIDILKIDIEGAERYIFSSIQSCETFLPFTKFLAMEIHEEFGIMDQVKQMLDYFSFEYFFAGELIIARNKSLVERSF